MFQQAKQNRTFEDIVAQIQENILQGKLKAGDKLPGERGLREIFKVSRGTLREALRTLEQKKLIRIKTGVTGGAIICPVDTQSVSDSLDLLLQYQKISLRELGEFRETVEGIVAAKVAQRGKKEDVQQLNLFLESIKNYRSTAELKWDEVMAEDSKFHLYLARVAGNKVFESVLHTVYDNFSKYYNRYLPREERVVERTYRDLCRILEAIEKRDAVKTQILVRNHVRYFNQMMEEGEKRQG